MGGEVQYVPARTWPTVYTPHILSHCAVIILFKSFPVHQIYPATLELNCCRIDFNREAAIAAASYMDSSP